MTNEQREYIIEALHRSLVLFDAVARFMDENPIAAEYTAHYDEATCDGSCLGTDCEVAAGEVDRAIAIIKDLA